MTRPWPPRVDVALLCFAANVIAHCDRVSLGAAAPAMMREFGWNTVEMGFVLSAFFVGYAAAMIPAGLLAQRAGPHPVFAWSMAGWSLVTLLTPLGRGSTAIASLRLLLGVGESGTAACINGTLARWFGPGEYARAAALCWSGGYAGPVVAFPLAAWLAASFGWRAVFIVFGLAGFLWLPLWLRAGNGPAGADAATAAATPAAPFRWRLLAAPSVWAVFLLHFSSNWFLYVMISWLPTYLASERKLNVAGVAAGSALPFVFAWLGANAAAWAMDRFGAHHGPARTRIRKLAMIPYSVTALAVFLLPRVESVPAAVTLLCASAALLAAATPVFSSASLDLAPDMAAGLAAFQNAFANIAGMIAPAAIGYAAASGPGGWQRAFALTAAVCLVGAAAYALLGRAEAVSKRS